MLEFLTTVPWLPSGSPCAWVVTSADDFTGVRDSIYLLKGKVVVVREFEEEDETSSVFTLDSPAIAINCYGENAYMVLCADLSLYIIVPYTMEPMALRDPASIRDVHANYQLNGYPPVPEKPTLQEYDMYLFTSLQ